jgi:hypothetical protein
MVDIAELLNQVGSVISPTTPPVEGGKLVKPEIPRWQRVLAGTLPEVGAAIATLPTELYSLADAGSRLAFDTPLPGAQGAREFSDAIRKPVRDMSNKLAGETVQDNLLTGDPEQLLGAWTRLGLTAGAVAPARVGIAVANAASKLKTGVDVVDKIGTGALKTLEVLSPVVISKNPTPGLVAANIGVAGGLGAGLEAILGPTDNVAQTKDKLDAYSKGAQDSAAEGIQEGKSIQKAGFLGDDPWENAAAFGLLGAAVFAGFKKDVAYRALTGLDKGEVTQVPFGTMLREQIGDAAAPIDAVTRQYLKSQGNKNARDIADAFDSRSSERHGASVDTKLQQTYEFGELPQSNIKITPINDTLTKYRSLTPDQQAMAVERLNTRHELDTRQRIAHRDIQGVNIQAPGTGADSLFQGITRMKGWDDSKVSYHMNDVSTSDLYKRWNNPVDPQATAVADEYLATMRRVPQYLYEQRALTKKEMLDLQRQNPNYVATKLAEGRSHLGELDPQAGKGLANPGNPFEELPKYFDEVVRFVEANKIRREFLGTMIRARDAGDKFAKSHIGRTDMRLDKSAHAGDLNVRFRDFDGRARDVEVLDPILRRALQNVGRPAALALIQGNNKALSTSARLFESAAVGPLAAVTGTVFAPISAMYSMGVGTAMRDKRFGAAGWLDKAVQSLTGGKIGVRGDVLTLAPDAAFRAAQGVGAVMAQRASRVLKDSVLSEGRLSKTLGPKTAQVVADALSSHFKRSWVSELQQRGQLGPASLLTVDPAKRFADAKKMLEGQGVIGQTGGLIGDILHAVSSAPAASLYAMNKSQPAWKVNKLVREFSGDPSKSGAFSSPVGKKIGGLTAVTPWGNIYLQANLRLAKAFKENPIATTVGIFNAVGLPAILSSLNNASLGPEYTDYQYNVRSPDRQAGYIYVGISGLRPEQGLEIPVDPLMRPFKHGTELLAAANLGLLDGSLFKEGNEGALKAIHDMVGSPEFARRQYGMGEGTVGQSLIQQTMMPPLPPIATAGAAMVGKKLRSYVDSSNIMPGRGGFTEGQGKNPHRSFLGMHEYPQMEEVVAGIGADAGRFIYNLMMDSGQMQKEGVGTGKIAERAGQRLKQRVGDSTKYVSGPLFETFQAIAPSTEAASQLVKVKVDVIKKINQAYNDATDKGAPLGNFVGSSKRGYQQGLGTGPSVAVDQPMMQLAEIVHRLGPDLAKEFQGTNKDLYNLRSQVANSTQFSPQMKRALMNGYAEQIINNNRNLLQRIELVEANLSKQFGREIKLDRVDLGKGIEQFKPLLLATR